MNQSILSYMDAVRGRVVVFDIDGTLANIMHRRVYVATKPKNWKAFNSSMHLDTPYEDIQMLSMILSWAGCTVLCCSGRGEESRKVTEQWLLEQKIPYDTLYMRAEGDYRQDSIVKVELLERIRAEFGEPFLWFDDRNQVVDAIRDQGVRVLQVAPGDF